MKQNVHPRLKGKGKSPLSESMQAEMAKRKAKPAAKAAAPAKKKPSLVQQAAVMAKGMKADVLDAVPSRNREVTRLYREKIDRHVDGKPPKKKNK